MTNLLLYMTFHVGGRKVVMANLMACGVKGLRKGRLGQMIHLAASLTKDEAYLSES